MEDKTNVLKLQQSQSKEVAKSDNPYTQLGNALSNRLFKLPLLKFIKGDYFAGQEARPIAIGTTMAVYMDTLSFGWVEWQASKPVDHLIGLVNEGFQPKRRAELGKLDKTQWEVDDNGEPRDPYVFTFYVGMRDTKSGEQFVFTTYSKGGRDAIGLLSKEYGEHMLLKPDEDPVVELGVDSYQHPIKSRGRIKIPVLPIKKWVPKEKLDI
jgi:hypothetical protein